MTHDDDELTSDDGLSGAGGTVGAREHGPHIPPPLNLTVAERAKLIAGVEKAATDPHLSPQARATAAKRASQLRQIQAKRVQQERLDFYGEGKDRIDEAVAMAHGDWAADPQNAPLPSTIGRIFQRLSDFIAGVGRVLRGHGFDTPESIFRKVARGEVGARDTGKPDADTQAAIDAARGAQFSRREGEPPTTTKPP